MQQKSLRDLDASCGGLLPLVRPLESTPAVRDDNREIWLTREELRSASVRLAGALASKQKQLVFLLCANRVETLIGLLAAAAAGQAILLADPSLPEDKLKSLVDAYRPEVVLGTRDHSTILGGVAGASSDWRAGDANAGDIQWIATDPTSPNEEINPALQLLLSTSGTTGSQKYVRLSRDAVLANAGQIAEALAIGADSVGIAHLPLHYSYGLSIVTSHLAAGGRVYLVMDSIISPSFWSKIRGAGGSHFPGVPFHYAALARLGAGIVPESVNVFTQAGGALDPRVQAKIFEMATRREGRFFVMYGQTEASPRMTTLQHVDFSRKAGSVGVALRGGRLSIVGEEGAPLQAGSVGAVAYDGPNVMLGYATSRSDLSKGDELRGRLETGDLGRLDTEGFLYLTGRAKRFAKISGYRLGLDEIEQELSTVCFVACLDAGEKIAVVHEQEMEAPLKSRVRELAATYKIPISSFSLVRTSQIPRGASGKVNYAQLKDVIGV